VPIFRRKRIAVDAGQRAVEVTQSVIEADAAAAGHGLFAEIDTLTVDRKPDVETRAAPAHSKPSASWLPTLSRCSSHCFE
jgi:hypothetical protein